jgi:hypothetical protein
MPIRPENKHRYPRNWPLIRARILDRAAHCCEECGVRNHVVGYREVDGIFVMTDVNPKLCIHPIPHWEFHRAPAGARLIEIVLTIAHLDHQPENCDDENLRALCQRCHLRYDQQHHAETAYRTRREGKAVADLFGSTSA